MPIIIVIDIVFGLDPKLFLRIMIFEPKISVNLVIVKFINVQRVGKRRLPQALSEQFLADTSRCDLLRDLLRRLFSHLLAGRCK